MAIHEAAYRVRPTEFFLALQEPALFRVARPDAFADLSHFCRMNMRFTVRGPVARVWEGYRTVNPLAIWSSARSWLVAVYAPRLGRTLHRADLEGRWPGFERGMKVFLDMSCLPVAITHRPAMMVALEITRLDARRRVIEYRYLEGSPSYGRQVLSFRRSLNDSRLTEIAHETWYRSYGVLVEAMYPLYHRQMLDAMHGRFREAIEGH